MQNRYNPSMRSHPFFGSSNVESPQFVPAIAPVYSLAGSDIYFPL
jgi:hypothetical protein